MKVQSFCVFLIIGLFLFNCKKEISAIAHDESNKEIDSSYLQILKMLEHNENAELKFNTDYFPNFKSDYQPTGKRTRVDSMIRHFYKILYRGQGNRFFDEMASYDSIKHIPFFDEFRLSDKTGYPIEKLRTLPNFDLKVFVDTTQFLKNPIQYFPKIDTGDEYPVYLINQSNQWYFRWFDPMSLTLIMEAYHKENQQWQPVEYQTTHSGFYMIIAPESYIVTSALIYDGDYSTKMRLKYKQAGIMTYSNEFYGKINKSQFDTISKENRDLLSIYHF